MNDHSRQESADASNRSLPSVKAQEEERRKQMRKRQWASEAVHLARTALVPEAAISELLDAFAQEVAREALESAAKHVGEVASGPTRMIVADWLRARASAPGVQEP